MWRIASRQFAALSTLLLLLAVAARGAQRPRYGGILRVEMHAAAAAPNPADATQAGSRILPLVFERLPALSVSWRHDAEFRRWQFLLRPGVRFQDGSPLTASPAVASTLESELAGISVSASGGELVFHAAKSVPDLLAQLGRKGFVFLRNADGTPTGTGQFRIAAMVPGRVTLAANEDYWGGRPFLDGIEIETRRTPRDQLIALELGRADLIELPPNEVRRARKSWMSSPAVLLALVQRNSDARVREAMALSIDRGAIHNVLLQRQGEITGALLPQWLSGYAFLFPSAPDLGRARRLAAEAPAAARSLALSYEPDDPLARLIAERIALNARDAGLSVQVSAQNPRAAVRLVRAGVRALDPSDALAGMAAETGLPEPARSEQPEALYAAEQALLEGFRVIPLFHLPHTFGVGGRVHVWMAPAVTRLGEWRLGDVWVEARP